MEPYGSSARLLGRPTRTVEAHDRGERSKPLLPLVETLASGPTPSSGRYETREERGSPALGYWPYGRDASHVSTNVPDLWINVKR